LVNTVTQIAAEHSKLKVDDGKKLSYDYLVIATGPRLAFDEVPGLGPDGFTQSVCSQDHSVQAWMRYRSTSRTCSRRSGSFR
jgi:sulfide:quinone oxidoreductase